MKEASRLKKVRTDGCIHNVETKRHFLKLKRSTSNKDQSWRNVGRRRREENTADIQTISEKFTRMNEVSGLDAELVV